ncbi:MAG: hypothetical protein H0V70_03540 [Ktedonobacteraceae bacterium]|nr:hypothetical protein [Ktedonobacteraceae bacterium]
MNAETEEQESSFYIAVIVCEFSLDAPDDQPLYREAYVLVNEFSGLIGKDRSGPLLCFTIFLA